jgi:uncharacterized protein (DUF1697 family)
VRTLLSSGNVVFDPGVMSEGEVAAGIEAALVVRLGLSARVVVISASALGAAVHGNPLAEMADNPARLLVAFVADPPDLSPVQPLLMKDWAPEALALGAGVVYLWCPGGVTGSPLMQAVGAVLSDAMTARNWTTVRKLLATASASDGG